MVVMSQHYTKNTLEDTHFCKTCNRRTQHKVSNGRLAHCLEHSPKEKKPAPKEKQLELEF
jgi:hypothetical protein